MKPITLTLLIILSPLYLLPAAADVPSDPSSAVAPDGPEVLAIRMYAEWCPHCRTIDAKIDEIKYEFTDEEVLFLYFDMTDEATISHTRRYASWLGLRDLFEEHVGNTGYMVLLDAATHEVIQRVTHDIDTEEIQALIAASIGR